MSKRVYKRACVLRQASHIGRGVSLRRDILGVGEVAPVARAHRAHRVGRGLAREEPARVAAKVREEESELRRSVRRRRRPRDAAAVAAAVAALGERGARGRKAPDGW
eukprot:1565135-Pleurochrysis_carterae.AAC.1